MDCLMGIAFKDFVVMASEMNTAQSILLMKDWEDKMHKLDGNLLLGACGDHGDAVHFSEFVSKNLALYRMRNTYHLNTARAAHFARRHLADYLRRSPYNVNLLLAGYDEKEGGQLYFVDYLATMQNVPYVAHGYGGLFSLSVMDRHYKRDATKEEAVDLMRKCMREVQQRLIINMPNFMVRIVDKDGIHDHGIIGVADLKLAEMEVDSSAKQAMEVAA